MMTRFFPPLIWLLLASVAAGQSWHDDSRYVPLGPRTGYYIVRPLHTSYRRNRTTSILAVCVSLSAVKARPRKYNPFLVVSAEWNNDAMALLVTTRSKFTILSRIRGAAEKGSRLPFTAHV